MNKNGQPRRSTRSPRWPADLASIVRSHWGIEDRLHWARTWSMTRTATQVRTGSGPGVMASMRNLAIAILRLTGHGSIPTPCATTPASPAGRCKRSCNANHDFSGALMYSRSLRFSRRSSASSLCSALVSPQSCLVPASRSACLTHSRTAVLVRPRSFATWPTDRSALAQLKPSALNSGVNGRRPGAFSHALHSWTYFGSNP
jgi:hypothetical protein